MDYNTIISWIVTGTFGWLFVALTGKLHLTKSFKPPKFYTFSLWLCMITSFIGLVLTLYDNTLALVFTPYVLITCALVYTSVDFFYLKAKNLENAPGWLYEKSKIYSALFQTMFIVAFVFLGFGIKKDIVRDKHDTQIENKIDSLDTKIDSNARQSVKERKELKDEIKASDSLSKKDLNRVEKKMDKQYKDRAKEVNKLSKTSKAIKTDTKEIREKVGTIEGKPKPAEVKKKRFLFF